MATPTNNAHISEHLIKSIGTSGAVAAQSLQLFGKAMARLHKSKINRLAVTDFSYQTGGYLRFWQSLPKSVRLSTMLEF